MTWVDEAWTAYEALGEFAFDPDQWRDPRNGKWINMPGKFLRGLGGLIDNFEMHEPGERERLRSRVDKSTRHADALSKAVQTRDTAALPDAQAEFEQSLQDLDLSEFDIRQGDTKGFQDAVAQADLAGKMIAALGGTTDSPLDRALRDIQEAQSRPVTAPKKRTAAQDKGIGVRDQTVLGWASPEELARARQIAKEKASKLPEPTDEDRRIAHERHERVKSRAGGDDRGNSKARKVKKQKLLDEFGDGTTAPCVSCGRLINFGTVSMDRIIPGSDNGRYVPPNLVGMCYDCNNARSNTPFKEMADTWATIPAAGTPVRARPSGWGVDVDSPEFIEAAFTGAGPDDAPTLEGVPEWIEGPLEVRDVPGYTKYIVGGYDADPSTIEPLTEETVMTSTLSNRRVPRIRREIRAAAPPTTARWAGVIGTEGEATGDGRIIAPGSLRWDRLPIPLRYVSSDVGAHDGAQVVGHINAIERRDTDDPKVKSIWAEGDFDLGSPLGVEAARQVEEKLTNGISMDLDDVTFEVEGGDGELLPEGVLAEDQVMNTTDARIRAATIVAIPAFANAYITTLGPEDALEDNPDIIPGNDVVRKGVKVMAGKASSRRLLRFSDEELLAMVETFAFDKSQWRVPRGNGRLSGRWLDMPDILGLLERARGGQSQNRDQTVGHLEDASKALDRATEVHPEDSGGDSAATSAAFEDAAAAFRDAASSEGGGPLAAELERGAQTLEIASAIDWSDKGSGPGDSIDQIIADSLGIDAPDVDAISTADDSESGPEGGGTPSEERFLELDGINMDEASDEDFQTQGQIALQAVRETTGHNFTNIRDAFDVLEDTEENEEGRKAAAEVMWLAGLSSKEEYEANLAAIDRGEFPEGPTEAVVEEADAEVGAPSPDEPADVDAVPLDERVKSLQNDLDVAVEETLADNPDVQESDVRHDLAQGIAITESDDPEAVAEFLKREGVEPAAGPGEDGLFPEDDTDMGLPPAPVAEDAFPAPEGEDVSEAEVAEDVPDTGEARMASDFLDDDEGPATDDVVQPAREEYVPFDDPELDAVAEHKDDPGKAPPQGTGTPEDPIYVGSDLDLAMDLLGEGKYVKIDPHAEDLRVLTEKMAASRDPIMDICKVAVGPDLFCAGSAGRPRVTMPQFASKNPLPGSVAAEAKGEHDEVDMSEQFKADLAARGVGITTDRRRADAYLPAQSEMLASKSAGIAAALRNGVTMPGTVFVSRDGYVIDGHHRWAAVAINTGLGEGDGEMDVEIVDMDIADVLLYANEWTEEMGLPHADIAGAPVAPDAAVEADQRSGPSAPRVPDAPETTTSGPVDPAGYDFEARTGVLDYVKAVVDANPDGDTESLWAEVEPALRDGGLDQADLDDWEFELSDLVKRAQDRAKFAGPIEAPEGWDVQVVPTNDGRLSIRGTGPNGEQVKGYQTAYGEWIAYVDDEKGWSSRPASKDPAGALGAAIDNKDNQRTKASAESEEFNWVDDVGGLPRYIKRIANALQRRGMTESHAIASAVNTVKRWARGGGDVKADTRAKAAAALAEWEAKKARARATRAETVAMTAAAAPVAPPQAWFFRQEENGPTPITITEEGEVYGHLATYDQCHIASPSGPGVCVIAPHSNSGYAHFHTGAVRTREGTTVGVGRITLDTGHAGPRMGAVQAMSHYDNTGKAVADVHAIDGVYGIWISGAVRPGVTESTKRTLRASPLSGDWRSIGGALELVAALAVNVPGFPVPRPEGLVASAAPDDLDVPGELVSLVAAGMLAPRKVRVRAKAPAAAGGGEATLTASDLRYLRSLADRERAREREELAMRVAASKSALTTRQNRAKVEALASRLTTMRATTKEG